MQMSLSRAASDGKKIEEIMTMSHPNPELTAVAAVDVSEARILTPAATPGGSDIVINCRYDKPHDGVMLC
jgi:hypothetical protein